MKMVKKIGFGRFVLSLMVLVFIIGIAIFIFAKSSNWNPFDQQSVAATNTSNQTALDQVSGELSQAVSIAYFQDPNGKWSDLRYQTIKVVNGNKRETKVYHFENGKIILYTFNPVDFQTVRKAPASDYSNGMLIADNVASTPEFNIKRINDTLDKVTNGTVLTNGETVGIRIPFAMKSKGFLGFSNQIVKALETDVELVNLVSCCHVDTK